MMFKRAPQTKKQEPRSGQIDELVTDNLQRHLKKQNVKILGSSNGILIDCGVGGKSTIFINVVLDADGIKYELYVISPELKGDSMVKRVPVCYTGILGMNSIDRGYNLDKIRVCMKQSPGEQRLIAVRISVWKLNREQSQDTISLLVIDPPKLMQKLDMLHLINYSSQDKSVLDFGWHPKGKLTLMTLLGNESLEIWNIDDRDFHVPSQVLSLSSLKKAISMPSQIKFTSFAPIDSQVQKSQTELQINKYSLFLMNNIGEIVSIFPFVPSGSYISSHEYDLIYEQRKSERKQESYLRSYLNDCQLSKGQSSSNQEDDPDYMVKSVPKSLKYYKVIKWQMSNIQIPITHALRVAQEIDYSQFLIIPIPQSECMLVVQARFTRSIQSYMILLSLLTKQIEMSSKSENVLYQIAEIKSGNGSGKYGEFEFVSTAGKQISGQQSIFYYERNCLLKMDVSSIFRFAETNDLRHLEKQEPFPVTLVLRQPPEESLLALAINRQQNDVQVIRRSEKKIKFDIQPLSYLNYYEELENINRYSKSLIKKLMSIKKQISEETVEKTDMHGRALKISEEELKKYRQKGVEQFKKDYADYCENMKNYVDGSMSKLKESYERLSKRVRLFKTQQEQRDQIKALLSTIKKNNEKIDDLLSLSARPQKVEKKDKQFADYEQRVNSLSSMFAAAKSKQLSMNEECRASMYNQASDILLRVQQIKQNLVQAKKLKKRIDQC